jgi:single-strand DNA-binding protein
MFNVNRVTLLGNATRDPETHATKAGKRLTTIGIGTSRTWTDEAGSRRSEPEFHRLVCFGKLAEFAADRVKKGTPLYVEGRLHTGRWESKDGHEQTSTEIIVDRLVLLSCHATEDRESAQTDE